MQPTLPLTRDLVLIGGGHAHALLLRRWGMRPVPGVRLTVITPEPTAPYTGMLPGYVAGHYARRDLEIDILRLTRFAGGRIILSAATGVDPVAQTVTVPGRPPVRYDRLSINVGITSRVPDVPGLAETAVPAKPLGHFAERWDGFVQKVAEGTLPPDIAVIGGGVGGVELALAMSQRLRDHAPRVALVEAADRILPDATDAGRRRMRAELDRAGVTVICGDRVAEANPTALVLSSDQEVPARFVVGSAGAVPHPWLGEIGLETHEGFITVDPMLRSVSDPAIYASGDCAHMRDTPRAKAGVFAVRQAPVLTANLRADLTGAQRRPFHPQRRYLKLISTGDKTAVADRGGLVVGGPAIWRWKDRIDRRFMDRLGTLPAMTAPPVPATVALDVRSTLGSAPLCGGCGAKVPATDLRAALDATPAVAHPDVLTGPGDDAALLQMGGAVQSLSVDHFRAFCEDPYTLARIAAVHAMGDIWAMGGVPQAALSSIILPRAADPLARSMMRDILDGAMAAFAAEGVALVGGHSSVGAELTVGFTVTGLHETAPVGLDGARPGDAIILTKPIGTGTVLAGDMRLIADGEDVAAALTSMTRSNAAAARILAPIATAMTDVTGFGLAGHLSEILTRSGMGA
ncbi:MAG: selenide, water dikinase SelD, partial [Pseudomonadota bacterium]